jgi:hypothetical protein
MRNVTDALQSAAQSRLPHENSQHYALLYSQKLMKTTSGAVAIVWFNRQE